MQIAAKLLFFAVIVVILYVYAGYPLILFCIGLFRKRRANGAGDRIPSVALIISAHNEERIIRDKIENSLKLDYPKDRLKIVIASDGSLDGTNDVVRQYEGMNIVLKSFDRREGKSSTLNRAVLGLDEDIIVFSDANAFYKEDAIKKLVAGFDTDSVGCVVGRLVYLDNNSYVGKGESLYWRYESLLNRLESRIGSVLVATGTIFAIRRELFRPVIKDVANDFQLPAEVADQGYDVVYAGEAIAYEKSTYFSREEFARKRRIIVRGLTGFGYLKNSFGGRVRILQFVTRKLLRWWIGAMLPLLYVSNLVLVGSPIFLTIFILQNIFYIFAVVGSTLRRGKVQSRIFFIPFYFVLVNGAALTAILTYLGGRRCSAWEKAETTRDVYQHPQFVTKLRVIEGNPNLSYSDRGESVENLERIT